MENRYTWWHTGRAFLTALLTIPAGIIAAISLIVVGNNTWLANAAAIGVVVAGVIPPFVVDRRALARGAKRSDEPD